MGYRKSAIAIFGGLVKLWRSDPEAGRAILLHELGHCRHGDVLMIGAGSFFETLLNSWVRFLILFFIIPTLFLYGWFLLGSLHEHWQLAQMLTATDQELNAINSQLGELGIEPTEIPSRGNWFVNWLIFQVGMLFTLGLPSTIASILALVLTTPIIISLPLMATWCAEFNADQFVVGEQMTQAPCCVAWR
ncbi:MAG: M48 family metalloprotease [Leptolyngbyaceae cyanobacterium SM2_5_2]|nr:M48 family metalloprotease [Leptolyngbyaceae cyanobacterium SM2_5_2]